MASVRMLCDVRSFARLVVIALMVALSLLGVPAIVAVSRPDRPPRPVVAELVVEADAMLPG
jgi:hypothetical protein